MSLQRLANWMWRTHHFFSVSCLFAQLQGSAISCPTLWGALRRQWGWRVSAGGCSGLLAGAWGFFLSFSPRKTLSLCILLSFGYQPLSSHLLGLADLSCHHPASYFDSGSQKAAHPPHSSPTTPPHLLGPPKEEEEKRFRKKIQRDLLKEELQLLPGLGVEVAATEMQGDAYPSPPAL